MINCLFKLIAASHGFACDSIGFLFLVMMAWLGYCINVPLQQKLSWELCKKFGKLKIQISIVVGDVVFMIVVVIVVFCWYIMLASISFVV